MTGTVAADTAAACERDRLCPAAANTAWPMMMREESVMAISVARSSCEVEGKQQNGQRGMKGAYRCARREMKMMLVRCACKRHCAE